LAYNGHVVTMWTHRQEQAEAINTTHKNETYIDVRIPEQITAYHDLKQAVSDVDAIVLVVPTKAIRTVCQQLNDVLTKQVTLIHASKGIEPKSLKRVSEMISEEMNNCDYEDIVVLSGTSNDVEVA